MPSQGRTSSSKTPQTTVAGCRRRCLPMFWFSSPERRSSAGRVDRPAGGDHGPRPHRHPVTVGGARLHPPRGSALDDHLLRAGVDEDARAGRVRVCEPCLHRGLLGAEPAAVTAVAALLPLLAASHVARHEVRVPSELGQAALQHLLARGRRVVLLVHAQSLADRVEARAVLLRRERRHAVRGPFLAHVVGGPERGRVVDRGTAAETAACQQADALVVRRGAPAVHVHAAVALQLAAVEVLVVVVAARFEHDHVEAGRSQHPGGGSPARSRAHHADVALERGVAVDVQRPQRLGRRLRILAEGPGVPDRVPDGAAIAVRARDHVVEQQRGLSQRLKGGPALRHAAVTPVQQHPFAPLRRQLGEAGQPTPAERGQQVGVPQRQQLGDLLPLGLTRVHRDGFPHHRRDAHAGRAGGAVGAGRERVANGVQGAQLLLVQLHRAILIGVRRAQFAVRLTNRLTATAYGALLLSQSGHAPRSTTSCSSTVCANRRDRRSIASSSAGSSNEDTLPQRSHTTW